MSVAKVILRNVASAWVGMATQIVVTLFLTPIVLSELGLEAYGLWLLLQGFVGYYGLVDMGLRAGITQSITRRLAAEDRSGVRRHITAAQPVLMKLSAAVIAIALIASFCLPAMVDCSPELRAAFPVVVIIQGIGVAIRLPLTPYSAVLVGLQRYDLANAIAVCVRIIYALAAYFVMLAGGGIIALSVTLVCTNLLDNLCRLVLAFRKVPELRRSVPNDLTKCDWKNERSELFQVGGWNLMIQVGRRLIYYSDALVIGTLFSAAAIVPYGLASSLVEYCNSLVKVSTRVLYPTMANLHVKGDNEQQQNLYLFSTRICLLVSIAFLIAGFSHIRSFLRLWLYDSPDIEFICQDAPMLFLLVGTAFAFVSLRRPGTQLLLAASKLKELATVQFCEAMINLILSIVLGWWLGVAGVALGTLIPALLLGLTWHLGAHAQVLQTTRGKILWTMIPNAAIYVLAMLGFTWVCQNYWLRSLDSWFWLSMSGLVHAIAILILIPIGLHSSERSAILEFLARRLFKNSSSRSSTTSDQKPTVFDQP